MAVLVLFAGLAPALAVISRNAWLEALAEGPSELDTLLVAVCGPIALALAAWLFVAIAVTAADVMLSRARSRASVRLARSADWATSSAWFEPPRPGGALLSRCAAALAPSLLRHGIAALLGVTLLSAPAAAASDAGSPQPSHTTNTITTAAISTAISTTSGTASTPTTTAGSRDSLSAAWPPVRAEVVAASQDRLVAPAHHDETVRGWVPAPPNQRSAGAGGDAGSAHDLGAVAATGRRRRLDDDERLVVRRGDTLWSIAARSLGSEATEAQIAGEWPRWFTANRDVIGPDPDRLSPGQRLRPPP